MGILLGGTAFVVAAIAFFAFSAELIPSAMVALGGITLMATGFFNLNSPIEKSEESADTMQVRIA